MIREFQLGGVKWTVEINNDKMDDRLAYGMTHYPISKIYLQDISEGLIREASAVEQVLYHEVVHAILMTMGENDLSANENFVQNFSMFLHQFEISKK